LGRRVFFQFSRAFFQTFLGLFGCIGKRKKSPTRHKKNERKRPRTRGDRMSGRMRVGERVHTRRSTKHHRDGTLVRYEKRENGPGWIVRWEDTGAEEWCSATLVTTKHEGDEHASTSRKHAASAAAQASFPSPYVNLPSNVLPAATSSTPAVSMAGELPQCPPQPPG
jgi:Domain of unknown function (DUF1918)